VYAALGLQKSIGKGACKLQGAGLDTRSIAPNPIELCNLPALFLSVHPVHTSQHFGPVLAFSTAGSGIDLEYGREFVFWFVKGGLEFGVVQKRESLLIGCLRLFFGGITPLPKFK
jgi:hypothetical protein